MEFDIDTLKDVLATANKAGSAVEALSGGFESIKKLFDTDEPIDDKKTELLIADLFARLRQAEAKNFSLQFQLSEILRAAENAKKVQDEFARYELIKTPAGQMLWSLRTTGDKAQEPHHYICPNCKESGRKSILQGHEEAVQCIPCQHWFRISESGFGVQVAPSRTRTLWDD